ncbi:MAG: amidohydrolase [Phycisphaerales bacterium]
MHPMKLTLARFLLVVLAAMSWRVPANAAAPHRVKQPADLIVVNALVHTVDPAAPRAAAFAVREGRIVAVGANEEVRAMAGEATVVVDAGGKAVVPGFFDAHLHPRAIFPDDSPLARVECGPDKAPDLAALIAALRDKAAITPKGMAIRGLGYEDTKLGRHPTRVDLDAASTDHPIIITHSSGHMAVANSLAFSLSRIDASTKDPAGGEIDRDANGEPTGLLREGAMSLIRLRGEGINPVMSASDRTRGLLACFDQYLAAGITAVGIAGADPDDLRAYRAANDTRHTVRMYVMMKPEQIEETASQAAAGAREDAWIRLGGVKFYHGNSLSGRTCWLFEPYADRPDYYGMKPARSQEALDALVMKVHSAGLQACVHANGDREIDMVLDAIEKALAARPNADHRHRIEHGSVVNQRILDRVKALGVVLAPHSYIWEHGDKMEAYGERRWPMMHPNGSAVRMGIPACGNSDSPVSPAIPMLRIQDLVTRRSKEGKVYGGEQAISASDALMLWTRGSAFACFWERDLGTIAPGKLADFVVLDGDPLTTPGDQLREIRVVETYVGGLRVWPRESAAE